jgi:uncharacterized protein
MHTNAEESTASQPAADDRSDPPTERRDVFRAAECARGLVEVAIVMAVVCAGMLLIAPFAPIAEWEGGHFGNNSLSKFLMLMVVPVIVIKSTGGALGAYGITFKRLSFQAKVGGAALLVYLPAAAGGFFVLNMLGWRAESWEGALVIGIALILALPLIGWLMRGQASQPVTVGSEGEVWVFLAVCAGLILVSALVFRSLGVVSVLKYGVLLTGVGEELFFRGYVQSTLNASLGRPFRVFGVTWGWGLVIASALFGLVHWLHPGGTVWWALWVFPAGLLLGFLREKTGSILAPSIVHGLPEVLRVAFVLFGVLRP